MGALSSGGQYSGILIYLVPLKRDQPSYKATPTKGHPLIKSDIIYTDILKYD
jgi:hypothetical protein